MERNFIKTGILLVLFCALFCETIAFSAEEQSSSTQEITTSSAVNIPSRENHAQQIFNDALKAKKEGELSKALSLFETALKTSPVILSQNDEGLIEELKKFREKEFAISPENPRSLENLAFVYSVCLGEPQGLLPFMKKAVEVANDAMYKKNLQMQIVRIEQEIAQGEALRIKAEQDARIRQNQAAEAAKLKEEKEAREQAIEEENARKQEEAEQAERDREEKEMKAAAAIRKYEELKNRLESRRNELNEELEHCNNAISIMKRDMVTSKNEELKELKIKLDIYCERKESIEKELASIADEIKDR